MQLIEPAQGWPWFGSKTGQPAGGPKHCQMGAVQKVVQLEAHMQNTFWSARHWNPSFEHGWPTIGGSDETEQFGGAPHAACVCTHAPWLQSMIWRH